MNKKQLIENIASLSDKWGLTDAKVQEKKIFEEFGELMSDVLNDNLEGVKKEFADVIITMITLNEMTMSLEVDDWIELIDYMGNADIFPLKMHMVVDEYLVYSLFNTAKKYNLDPWECLENKYNIVSKREGELINGTFVKKKLTLMEKLMADMEKKNMLRTHLAEKTGYSEGNLSRIWNDKLIPSVVNYEKMRKAVDEYGG